MSLKHGILGLLTYGEKTGYDLSKFFKSSLALFWDAKTSQIYRELDKMEENGWLSSRSIIQSDKPNKRVYSITEYGQDELMDWLCHPETDIDDAMRVKSAFLMRIFFSEGVGRKKTLEVLYKYKEKCQARMAEIGQASVHIKNQPDAERTTYWQLTAMFGETMLEARINWADKAIAVLEG